MSEEKLYAVKNDEGLLLSYSEQGAPLWRVWGEMLADKPTAEITARAENSHVVTLIEKPEKVVLTKEQAEIVENAHEVIWPLTYISGLEDSSVQRLLMKAYVNGYTVAKEKKYNVKVPLVQTQGGLWFFINSDGKLDATYFQGLANKFTMDEIEENGLQGCERVVCADSARTTGEAKDHD